MISPKYIALAVEKASNAEERQVLARIEAIAAELAALERDFPDRLAAARVRRNEPPVKLTKNQREMLAEMDDDMAAAEREQLVTLRGIPTAMEIVEILSFSLPGQHLDWSFMLPEAHPDDRPAIEDIVQRQRALRAAMRDYLDRYGPGSGI